MNKKDEYEEEENRRKQERARERRREGNLESAIEIRGEARVVSQQSHEAIPRLLAPTEG